MSERPQSRFERLPTGTKLLLLLTVALLPLGLAIAWTARTGISGLDRATVDVAHRQGLSGARAVEGVIARNALALRVAANGAIREGRNPCGETAMSLALTPAVGQRFAIADTTGTEICSQKGFPALREDVLVAPGAIRVWASPDEQSVFYRVGVVGGMATGSLSVDELAQAVRTIEPGVKQLAVRDSRGVTLDVLGLSPGTSAGRLQRSSFKVAGDDLEVRELTSLAPASWRERLWIMLPLIMFVVAAVGSWLLVRSLLLNPLARLQRAINDYQPGADRLVLPERLGSAEEIRLLGRAFEKAVDRIEASEQQMAEALAGQRRLVREVHHRVKNNLQVIASLLSIHGRSANTPESRAAYAAIGRRVDALSVVHRNHFAEGEDTRGIPLRPLLVELAAILRASNPDKATPLNIQLDVDSLHTTQDAAVAVSFFVTEVVEHAMLTAPGDMVEIQLRRLSELAASLTVMSNALVAPDDDRSVEREQFERVVQGLARQLRSPLESKLGRLSVHLPVFPDRV